MNEENNNYANTYRSNFALKKTKDRVIILGVKNFCYLMVLKYIIFILHHIPLITTTNSYTVLVLPKLNQKCWRLPNGLHTFGFKLDQVIKFQVHEHELICCYLLIECKIYDFNFKIMINRILAWSIWYFICLSKMNDIITGFPQLIPASANEKNQVLGAALNRPRLLINKP